MEEKPNNSQNEYNNIPQTTDGMTPIEQSNDNSFQEKTSFFNNKKNKIILISIIGIIVLGIIIGIAIACSKKKNNNKEIIDNSSNTNENEEEDEEQNVKINLLNLKLNEILVYEETQDKTINVILNENAKKLLNNLRSLSETKLSNQLKIKYLINIYKVDENVSPKVKYAYVSIISMENKLKNTTSNLLNLDIRNISSLNDEFPVAKIKFNDLGEKIEVKISKNLNRTYAAYLNDFIDKIIPQMSENSFNSERRLNTDDKRNIKNDGKNTLIEESHNGVFSDEIDDSSQNVTLNTEISDEKVKKIIEKKKSSLFSNNDNQVDVTSDNDFSYVQDEQSSIKQNLIEGINTEINSITLLNEDESEVNEELTNKINTLMKNVNLDNYNNVSKKRKLEFIPNKQFERKIRKLNYDIETYANPIYFTYPLFRTNNLGMKIGLLAKVEFLPVSDEIKMKIIFNLNGEETEILTVEEKTDFNSIIQNINKIMENAYLVIKEIESNITLTLNELQLKVDEEIQKLSDLLSNIKVNNTVFYEELKLLLTFVNETTANCYNICWENTNKTNETFVLLEEDIKNNKIGNVESIITNYQSSLENFLILINDNVTSLYEIWNEFYTNSSKQLDILITKIKNEERITIETGVYYNLKDLMKRIVNIYENFNYNLLQSIKDENATIYYLIKEKFDTIVNPQLKEVELIAEKAENNASLIDAMDIFFGSDVGTYLRKRMITQINNLRNLCSLILDEIYSKIKNVHESSISTNQETQYKKIVDNISTNIIKMTNEYNILLSKLEGMNKFDNNFDVYFEDIKIINEIEEETLLVRKESYRIHIIEYLNSIEKDLLKDYLKPFEDEVKRMYNEIFVDLNDLNFANGELKANNTYKKIKQLINNYLGDELVKNLTELYSDPNIHRIMLENYYIDVNSSYSKFNSTFYQEYYLKHGPSYVIKPTEAMSKLLNITYYLNNQREILFENIQNVIIQRIENSFVSLTNELYGILYNQYYNFTKELKNNKCCINGYNTGNTRVILNKLNETFNLVEDINIKGKFNRTKKDEFGFLELYETNEDYILIIIKTILDQINKDFHDYFCYGSDIICKFNDSKSAIEHYYYKAGHLRSSSSNLNLFIPIAEKMIRNNILSELSSDEYANKFYYQIEYKIGEIASKIIENLELISEKTEKHMEGHISTLFSHINSSFIEKINIEGINETLYLIAKNIFVNPINLSIQMYNYLNQSCGPFDKLETAFNKEISQHRFLSNNSYSFNEVLYRQSYEILVDKMNEKYNEKKNQFLKNLEVPSEIINDIKKYISGEISKAYTSLYNKILSMNEILDFQFLYSKYSLRDLSFKLLDNITQEIIDQTNENVIKIYNNGLNLFRENILKDFQKDYEEILNFLEYELNSTANLYNKQQNPNSNYLINHVNISTEDVIENIVELFFKKAEEVYNNDDIKYSFEKAQNISMENYTFNNDFDDFSSLIIEDIINFSEMSILRYNEEQNEFKSIIKVIFEDSFNDYVNNYINNVGHDYLTQIVNEDYEMNIADTFRFLNSNIKDIYNFMNALLDTSELKALGYELITGIRDLFPFVRNKVIKIIPDKIEQIIYPKIDIFKSEIQNKIVKVFVNYITSDESLDYLSSLFSSEVYKLIPKKYTDSFYAILEGKFNTLISNSISNMKNLYNTNIRENLNIFNETFYGYESLIKDTIKGVVSTKPDENWLSLIRVIEKIEYKVEPYDVEILFITDNDTLKGIDDFFKESFYNNLSSIIYGYNEQVRIGQQQLKDKFSKFTFTTSYDKVKEGLNNINFENQIKDIQYNIKKYINNINTISIISGLSSSLEDYSKNVKFTGFNAVNRRLEEYSTEPFNISYIEEAVNVLKEKYIEFQTKILNDNTFGTIANQKYSFNNYFTEAAQHLTDYFYSYRELIGLYSNISDIDELFKKFENSAKQIRTLYLEFSNKHSDNIDKVTDTVRNQLLVLWENTRGNINKYVYNSLNKLFADKFKSINNIPFKSFSNETIPNIGTINLNNEKGEKIVSVNVTLHKVNANANYEFYKSNPYDFTLIMNAGSSIYMSLESTIGDFYQSSIEGDLVSGDIGIQTDYILHDQSVDIDAYFTQKNNHYFNVLKEYNFDNNNWIAIINKTEEIQMKDNIHMKKSYRKRW